LDDKGIEYSGKYENNRISDFLFSWIIPLLFLYFVWKFFFKNMNPGMGVMRAGKSNAKLYDENDNERITFDDIAGADEAKEELREVVEFLVTPDKFSVLGGRLPKGVLLVGAPGTGKTLLAKAVAGEAKSPFFNISGSEFVEMFVGVGAARVRDLFAQAKEKAPCLIFIDELDAIGKSRGVSPIGGHDEREQTLNQILVEMDGFDTQGGVIIMAATNRPEVLDPALLRPGRFDRQVLVDRPDVVGREAILKIHTKRITLSKNIDLKVLAKRTSGFVGSDLANIANESALLAARKSKKEVEMEDMEEAIERSIVGLEKKSKVINEKERMRVAIHEIGHALISELICSSDKLHKISIIPRGLAGLGYTMQLPEEDRYLMTKEEILGKIDVLLGGRGAEKIILNSISSGAQNDLENATAMAKSMVARLGMSEEIGLVILEKSPKGFLGNQGLDFANTRDYSDDTARKVDELLKNILNERYKKVLALLDGKKEILKKASEVLLEKETMDGAEFKALIKEEEEAAAV